MATEQNPHQVVPSGSFDLDIPDHLSGLVRLIGDGQEGFPDKGCDFVKDDQVGEAKRRENQHDQVKPRDIRQCGALPKKIS
jgi:hypothetical protein